VQLTATGANFVGTPGAEVKRRISDGDVVNVNTDGAAVFGFSAGDDVFSVVTRLAASVRSGNTASINNDAAALDARATDIRASLGDVGARAALVDSVTNRHEDNKLVLSDRLGAIEDVDMNTAAMEFAQANRTYQAVLATVGQTQRVSLIDFLH
jgi:flagellar hook-associated protein 3 FlgL